MTAHGPDGASPSLIRPGPVDKPFNIITIGYDALRHDRVYAMVSDSTH